MSKLIFNLGLGKRLLLLLLSFILFFVIQNVISFFVLYRFGTDSTPAYRIITVLQDVFVFILPALLTAMLSCRQPATLLGIDRKPAVLTLIVSICALLVSVPAMNFVVWANQQFPFPAYWAEVFQKLEDSSAQMVEILCGVHNTPNLIMSILIVGVFAGLSEEILFRGGLQRLLITGDMNHHAAIWITAVVFSMLHMQFYGFVPRMLLGAFFGYTFYWSRSLWVPILLHTINNTLVVVDMWISSGSKTMLDTLGAGDNYFAVIASAVLTCIFLYIVYKTTRRQPSLSDRHIGDQMPGEMQK